MNQKDKLLETTTRILSRKLNESKVDLNWKSAGDDSYDADYHEMHFIVGPINDGKYSYTANTDNFIFKNLGDEKFDTLEQAKEGVQAFINKTLADWAN